jgi:hypothetical protein
MKARAGRCGRDPVKHCRRAVRPAGTPAAFVGRAVAFVHCCLRILPCATNWASSLARIDAFAHLTAWCAKTPPEGLRGLAVVEPEHAAEPLTAPYWARSGPVVTYRIPAG